MNIAAEQVRRVAVLRALQLGDLLCAVPALRSLRAALPQAEITLIGLPWSSWFVQRFSRYLDRHLCFPGFPGWPETAPDPAAIPAFLEQAQRARFDLVLQLHGSGTISNPLAACLGGRVLAGYYREGEWLPDAQRFLPWQDEEHEIRRGLRLLRRLGIPAEDATLEFPIVPEDRRKLRRDNPALAPAGAYACIHPGSQLPSRRWPPERFAAIADRLAQAGLQPVITGTAQEAALTGAVAAEMRMPALDLSGRTGLGGLAALVEGAAVVVCNDTGISHIAAALATPSAVISSGADIRRWAPLDRRLHRVLHHAMPCRPCAHAVCPLPGHPCAAGISVETVWTAVGGLLEEREAEGLPPPPPRAAAVTQTGWTS